MNIFIRQILFLSIILLVSSCATNNSLRKPIFNTTTYKGQTGEKEVTNINKSRAEREKDLYLAMEKADATKRILEQQQGEMEKIDTTERVDDIELALLKIYERTEIIIAELNSTSPYSMSGQEIEKLANSIDKDLKMWEDYLMNHNANVFNDSLYRLMIIVNGYADEQGRGNDNDRKEKNKILSEKRAQSVADELMKQIQSKEIKPELIIDIEINGRGELLPPNITESTAKKNSPDRRISRVSMVLGPKILLYNN